MAAVGPKTSLLELRARLRAMADQELERTERLLRSVRQSLRVEGYDVSDEAVRAALESAKRADPH